MQHSSSPSDRRQSTDPLDAKIDELLRTPVSPPAQLYQQVMQRIESDSTESPARGNSAWKLTLLGLAALTMAGAFAFYTLFDNAPAPYYLASIEIEAPLSSEIDELLAMEEMLQPVTHLASINWDTIEALMYQ